jgi:hypothetical protein
VRVLSRIFVSIAWCIPGASHRWAKRLMAERKAAMDACDKYGLKF